MQSKQKKRSLFQALAIVVLAVLVAAGCGGEAEEGGSLGAATGAQGTTGETETGQSGRPGEKGEDKRGKGGAQKGSGGSQGSPEAERPDGGSDESGESGGEANGDAAGSSKTRFIKQADAICARSKAKTAAALSAYLKRGDGLSGGRTEEALEKVHVPAMEARLVALRRLDPPPGDEAEVDAVYDAIEAWVRLARQEGVAAKAAIDRGVNRAAALARRYGFTECGSG